MLSSSLKNSVTGSVASAGVYTDLQGLSGLRRKAAKSPDQALEQVARQFESLFIQMMLKSMRDASLGEGLFDNNQSELFRDMYDKQLSLHLSEQGGGIGLAKVMVDQMRTSQGSEGIKTTDELSLPRRGNSRFQLRLPQVSVKTESQQTNAAVNDSAKEPVFDSPQAFIEQLRPHAERIGQRLGIDPRAILAQSALETGWGKAVIRRTDGSSSHNMFNIKAQHGWDGMQVGKNTLEYRQGVAVQEKASFRGYGDVSASFEDYADFLQQNPRYAEALALGDNADAYVQALQDAGYATDPNYAKKIRMIMAREEIAQL